MVRVLLALVVVSLLGCSGRPDSAPTLAEPPSNDGPVFSADDFCFGPVIRGKPPGYVPSEWSIGILRGETLATLREAIPGSNPVLRSSDIVDRTVRFTADPFMVKSAETWHMFFEVMNCGSEQGDIAHAVSSDGYDWRYQSIVLDEQFHLSYPHVFEVEGRYYMLPESRQGGGIRLYVADDFPSRWRFLKTLIPGDYADPSITFHEGRWWIFAVQGGYSLAIFYSERLDGPWQRHAGTPFYPDDKSRTRPAGRMVREHGRLVRFAQDNRERYGHRVRAFIIERLSPDQFHERELQPGSLLGDTGTGWSAVGMHHIDAHRSNDGTWIAVVDGAAPAVRP